MYYIINNKPVISVGWRHWQQPPTQPAFPLGKAENPSVVGRERGKLLGASFHRTLPETPSALGRLERPHEPPSIPTPTEARRGSQRAGKQGGRDGDAAGRGIEKAEERHGAGFFLCPDSWFFAAVFIL